MSKELSIELYEEDGVYGAYIGEDNASGYDIKGNTIDEVAERVAEYIKNAF